MNKNKYTSLIKNSLWGSSSFLFITAVSFLILPFIIKKLTVEGYGIYVLATSLIGYFGILDFGLGFALVKFVSEFKEKNEYDFLNLYINSVIIFQFLVGFAASWTIYFFAKEITHLLNVSKFNTESTIQALRICSFGFFFTFVAGAYKSALQGLQLYKFTSIIDSISNLVLNFSILIILYHGYGLVGAIVANVVTTLIVLFIYIITFSLKEKEYRFILKVHFGALRQIFSFSSFVFLSQISNIFSTYIVRFVITIFLGPSAVTYYVVPSKIIGAVGGLASNAINVVFPFTSQMNVRDDKEGINKLFIEGSSIFTSLIIPIIMLIVLFSYPILLVWMGEEFAEQAWLVLSIITFSGFLGSLSTIPNLLLLGQGNSHLIGIFSIITIFTYTIFLPVFTKYFGIIGTALALLIASSTIIYYVLLKSTQFHGINLVHYLKMVLGPHIIPLVLLFVLFTLTLILDIKLNLFSLIIGISVMSFYYFYLFKNEIIPLKKVLNSI